MLTVRPTGAIDCLGALLRNDGFRGCSPGMANSHHVSAEKRSCHCCYSHHLHRLDHHGWASGGGWRRCHFHCYGSRYRFRCHYIYRCKENTDQNIRNEKTQNIFKIWWIIILLVYYSKTTIYRLNKAFNNLKEIICVLKSMTCKYTNKKICKHFSPYLIQACHGKASISRTPGVLVHTKYCEKYRFRRIFSHKIDKTIVTINVNQPHFKQSFKNIIKHFIIKSAFCSPQKSYIQRWVEVTYGRR